MATDYFAHSVFGVVLGGKPLATFLVAYNSTKSKLLAAYSTANRLELGTAPDPDELEDLWYQSVCDLGKTAFDTVLAAIPPKSLARVRRAVGAPDDAAFLDTGGFDALDSRDDRPGRCYTEDARVVVGFGPFSVLKMVKDRFKKGHRKLVDYQAWVTSG